MICLGSKSIWKERDNNHGKDSEEEGQLTPEAGSEEEDGGQALRRLPPRAGGEASRRAQVAGTAQGRLNRPNTLHLGIARPWARKAQGRDVIGDTLSRSAHRS